MNAVNLYLWKDLRIEFRVKFHLKWTGFPNIFTKTQQKDVCSFELGKRKRKLMALNSKRELLA
jgi:hypothetical protein